MKNIRAKPVLLQRYEPRYEIWEKYVGQEAEVNVPKSFSAPIL